MDREYYSRGERKSVEVLDDVVALKKMGVAEVLLQDTPPEMIVNTVRTLVRERGAR